MEIYDILRNTYRQVTRAVTHWKNRAFDHKPKLLILSYHRILPRVEGRDPLRIIVSLNRFKEQVDSLIRSFSERSFISLSEAIGSEPVKHPGLDTYFTITFDDGYGDVYEHAFPFLRDRNIPAALFISTEFAGKRFPVDRIVPKSISERLMQKPHFDYGNNVCLAWDEIAKMRDGGFEIGSHGVSHRSLAGMPLAEAEEEIQESKVRIETMLNRRCRYFAFPFGSRKDYNAALVDRVRSAGYGACLLNIHGYNHFGAGDFCLKRIIMEEGTSTSHLLG